MLPCAFRPAWCLVLAALWLPPIASAQEIRFDGATFRVVDWDGLAGSQGFSAEEYARLFAIYVDAPAGHESAQLPAVTGSYRIEAGALVFEPRYPPVAGVSYRAVFDPSAIGRSGSSVSRAFDLSRPRTPPAVVEHVYPSAHVLPENQLKLYIHFSAPMTRGEAYRHIRLLDENDQEVELAFLELTQELWTRDFRRFTILFDPGRIKTGLVPNLEEGRALVPGRTYTLVIGGEWRDGNGQPLLSEYRKTFRAGPFDDVAPDTATWRLRVPDARTRDPIAAEFDEPLDRGLLGGLLTIVDSAGGPIEGTVDVDRGETRWLFVPANRWQPGGYQLVVGTELEDLAGNALNGLFEVDLRDVDETRIVQETESLPFEISPP